MNTHEPFLKIRFDGQAVGSARIPVDYLLRFLGNFNKALQRVGRVLQGEAESVRRGAPARDVKSEVSLDLVFLTQGSPAAVLGFERKELQQSIPGFDTGAEIFEKLIEGLAIVQDETIESLPAGYDAGVLTAWRDAGILFRQNIARIEITLNHRASPIKTVFVPEGFDRIQKRIQGPQTNIRTIEGRLLMADFKEHGTRCRIHPSAGDPVLCLFDKEMKEEVFENILQYVRIVGEAKENPMTGRIDTVRIHDIERLEDQDENSTDLLPQGTPLTHDFWDSPTLDELALSQNVTTLRDVQALYGTWPGEMDDGFESEIDRLRHESLTSGGLR
jgi:hypothetical protein